MTMMTWTQRALTKGTQVSHLSNPAMLLLRANQHNSNRLSPSRSPYLCQVLKVHLAVMQSVLLVDPPPQLSCRGHWILGLDPIMNRCLKVAHSRSRLSSFLSNMVLPLLHTAAVAPHQCRDLLWLLLFPLPLKSAALCSWDHPCPL